LTRAAITEKVGAPLLLQNLNGRPPTVRVSSVPRDQFEAMVESANPPKAIPARLPAHLIPAQDQA
jgi:hypothetical protein